MKILAITDSYPPHHSGGYELRSRDILDSLNHHGHGLLILTTKCPLKGCDLHMGEKRILRKLHKGDPADGLVKKIFNEFQDVHFIHSAINRFKPDLVYLFHVINLTRSMYPYLADCKIPIIFDEGGRGYLYAHSHRGPWYGYTESESASKIKKEIVSVLIVSINRMSGNLLKMHWKWPENIRIYFNSQLNQKNAQDAGLNVAEFPVIHSGINIQQFLFRPRSELQKPIQILVPGRIEPRKGQLDSIYLLADLLRLNINASLTIVGINNSDSYFQELLEKVGLKNLAGKVKILPMVDYENLARFYQEADICFFTSYAKTGFSRVPLEAMACGCLVITYGYEGSNEIIDNGTNGFIVSDRDFEKVTKIILNLSRFPEEYRKIVENAKNCIEKNHTMDLYVDKIESFLQEAVYVPGSAI
jgi:glycosyltransferase involved in cell wall biosynthesis